MNKRVLAGVLGLAMTVSVLGGKTIPKAQATEVEKSVSDFYIVEDADIEVSQGVTQNFVRRENEIFSNVMNKKESSKSVAVDESETIMASLVYMSESSYPDDGNAAMPLTVGTHTINMEINGAGIGSDALFIEMAAYFEQQLERLGRNFELDAISLYLDNRRIKIDTNKIATEKAGNAGEYFRIHLCNIWLPATAVTSEDIEFQTSLKVELNYTITSKNVDEGLSTTPEPTKVPNDYSSSSSNTPSFGYVSSSNDYVPSSDYTSAPELDLTGNWSSAIAINEDDVHWYKITLTETGRVNARIMSYVNSFLKWELWDGDFSEKLRHGYVSGGTETSPKTISDDFVLSAGVYYYKINSDRTGSYKIYDEFLDYMVNDQGADSYDSPYDYNLGTKITGAVTATNTEDWYKISINKDAYYHQTIMSYFHGNLKWKLWNQDLTEEIKSGGLGDSSETVPASGSEDFYLESGIYYIKIWDHYDQIYTNYDCYGKYIFQFDKLTKKNCNHDYNSSWYDATYFAKGYKEYVCEKCGDSYRDNYKDVKVLSQGYLYYPSVEKNTIKLSWSKVYDASGYQIRYSTKKNFKSDVVVKTVKDVDVTEKTIKKLKRKTKYYVQVRPYKKGASKTVYGKWSEKKWIRTE